MADLPTLSYTATNKIAYPCITLSYPGRGGGGYFRTFWVGMCCWDPGTLSLYLSFK